MVRFHSLLSLSSLAIAMIFFGGTLQPTKAFGPWRQQQQKRKHETPCSHNNDDQPPKTRWLHRPWQIILPPRGGSQTVSNGISSPSSSSSFLDMISDTKWKCWVALLASICVENLASALMKAARMKKSVPLLLLAFFLFLLGNAGFFVAVSKIELGIAYAVWSALGTMVLTTVGVCFFEESYDLTKLGCLVLIVVGVVGLNLREEH